MKLQLPNSVSSQQDVTSLVLQVHQYARWFSQAAIKQRVNASRPDSANLPSLSGSSAQTVPQSAGNADVVLGGLQSQVGQIVEPPAITPAASELIQQWGAKEPLNQRRLDELIAALEEFKQTAPSLTITLAAPAPGDLKQTLVGWCRQNISPDTLVTFKFNATILGGMVVHYDSHIFDWSFRRQILAARAKFPEILRRV